MKLTNSKSYQDYMMHYAARRFDLAEKSLKACLGEVMLTEDIDQLVYMLQTMGNVLYESGKYDEAIAYYELASQHSSESPEESYGFAIFLADKLTRYSDAVMKCDELIGRANMLPDNDVDKKYYLASGYALKGYCQTMIGKNNEASKSLHSLLDVNNETVTGHAIKLCEKLMSQNEFVEEAKGYLQRIEDSLSANDGVVNSRNAPLLEHVRKLMGN